MKKILALILLLSLAFFAYQYINQDLIAPYGQAKIDQSVSSSYVTQSVKENPGFIEYGKSENLELGAANAVTNIVLGYRALDTLGEVTVLFISAIGVSIIINTNAGLFKRSRSGFILRVGAKMTLPIILVVAVFVITHGHLTPGGGFQGGAMIAAGMLLMALSDPDFLPSIKNFKILEGISGTAIVLVGLIGFATTGYFLSNFMNTGQIGHIFSAGTLPILYVFIGLKVGSELTNIITDIVGKEATLD